MPWVDVVIFFIFVSLPLTSIFFFFSQISKYAMKSQVPLVSYIQSAITE